ncbi:unnamed protein product [Orchesella dallaii]|uniref:Uncharacterized protein n=1 Tax=Orchesella dallaii TaxID=48710 RepID=A0ABP1R1E9_9HEXA
MDQNNQLPDNSVAGAGQGQNDSQGTNISDYQCHFNPWYVYYKTNPKADRPPSEFVRKVMTLRSQAQIEAWDKANSELKENDAPGGRGFPRIETSKPVKFGMGSIRKLERKTIPAAASSAPTPTDDVVNDVRKQTLALFVQEKSGKNPPSSTTTGGSSRKRKASSTNQIITDPDQVMIWPTMRTPSRSRKAANIVKLASSYVGAMSAIWATMPKSIQKAIDEERRVLYISGTTGLGKSELCGALFPTYLMCSSKSDFKLWNSNHHTGLLLDNMSPTTLGKTKELLGFVSIPIGRKTGETPHGTNCVINSQYNLAQFMLALKEMMRAEIAAAMGLKLFATLSYKQMKTLGEPLQVLENAVDKKIAKFAARLVEWRITEPVYEVGKV